MALSINDFNVKGLTDEQVILSRATNGQNVLKYKTENVLLKAIKSIVKQPMILLLLVASLIYFISGEVGDAIYLSSAIFLIGAISLNLLSPTAR
jgi:Ca2+-transporting ATPase